MFHSLANFGAKFKIEIGELVPGNVWLKCFCLQRHVCDICNSNIFLETYVYRMPVHSILVQIKIKDKFKIVRRMFRLTSLRLWARVAASARLPKCMPHPSACLTYASHTSTSPVMKLPDAIYMFDSLCVTTPKLHINASFHSLDKGLNSFEKLCVRVPADRYYSY